MTPQTVERGEPAAAERAELPGRVPAAAVLRSRRRRRRTTTARSAPIIGHEISHSFDDQGSQFDAEGRLANWWTPDDLKHFKAAEPALAAQYDATGRFRISRSTAIRRSARTSPTLQDSRRRTTPIVCHLATGPTPTGMGLPATSSSSSASRRAGDPKDRDEDLRQRIATDGHAPDEYRADTVRNLDPWYSAFDVQPAAKLFLPPTGRVHVW